MNIGEVATAAKVGFDFIFHWAGVWLVMNGLTALVARKCGVKIVGIRKFSSLAAGSRPAAETRAEDDAELDAELTPEEKTALGAFAAAAVTFREMADAARAEAEKRQAKAAERQAKEENGKKDSANEEAEEEDGREKDKAEGDGNGDGAEPFTADELKRDEK